jgi:hypothetical protein
MGKNAGFRKPKMSAEGQSRRFDPLPITSGLTRTADISLHALCNAMCHQRTHAPQQTTELFDHLVGGREQRRRHGQPERLRGLEMNDELEICRLLYRKFGRVRAFKNSVHISGGSTEDVRRVRPMRHEPAFDGERPIDRDSRQPGLYGELSDPLDVIDVARVGQDDQTAARLFA